MSLKPRAAKRLRRWADKLDPPKQEKPPWPKGRGFWGAVLDLIPRGPYPWGFP